MAPALNSRVLSFFHPPVGNSDGAERCKTLEIRLGKCQQENRDVCVYLIIYVNPVSAPPSTPSFWDTLEKRLVNMQF